MKGAAFPIIMLGKMQMIRYCNRTLPYDSQEREVSATPEEYFSRLLTSNAMLKCCIYAVLESMCICYEITLKFRVFSLIEKFSVNF